MLPYQRIPSLLGAHELLQILWSFETVQFKITPSLPEKRIFFVCVERGKMAHKRE